LFVDAPLYGCDLAAQAEAVKTRVETAVSASVREIIERA
jgi:hypothetical protein